MFYRKCTTTGYISVHYFRFENFILDHFVYFLKAEFKSSQLHSVFERDMLNKYVIFSNSKNNRLNIRDFNIDQNNRDYDFFHFRAALSGTPQHSARRSRGLNQQPSGYQPARSASWATRRPVTCDHPGRPLGSLPVCDHSPAPLP